MTPDLLRTAIYELDLGPPAIAAKRLGCERRTFFRYLSGDLPIPGSVQSHIETLRRVLVVMRAVKDLEIKVLMINGASPPRRYRGVNYEPT